MILQKVIKFCAWKDATIFSISLAVVIQLIVLLSPYTARASVFDDFNNGKIDGSKWAEPEAVRIVENGALSMALSGHAAQSGDDWIATFLKDSSLVTKLQATVTIESYQLDPDITGMWNQLVGADLFGTFYESTADGYLEAGVVIIDINDGEGLKAWCWAETEEAGTIEIDSEFAQSMDIETGDAYTIGIEYNQSGGDIICSINDGTTTETHTIDVSAAEYSDLPDDDKGLSVWYENDSAPEADYSIAAVFDDVETQAGAYDDFSSNTLSSTKWSSAESERIITNNSLQLSQHNNGGSLYKNVFLTTADGVSSTDYYQASITVDSESSFSAPLASGQAIMGGVFYNDLAEGGTNGMEGDVICQINLGVGSMFSSDARIFRCNNADCSDVGHVFIDWFEIFPWYGTQHTVSIKKRGDFIVFAMDGKSITHQIPGNMFSPSNSSRMLGVNVSLSDPSESGNITAFFDDVFFKEKAFPWTMFLPAITGKRQ